MTCAERGDLSSRAGGRALSDPALGISHTGLLPACTFVTTGDLVTCLEFREAHEQIVEPAAGEGGSQAVPGQNQLSTRRPGTFARTGSSSENHFRQGSESKRGPLPTPL